MSAQLARNIEVRAAAYVHSGVDSIRDIARLLHRWGHHNDTVAVLGKLKCILSQLEAINLQRAGVEVEPMIDLTREHLPGDSYNACSCNACSYNACSCNCNSCTYAFAYAWCNAFACVLAFAWCICQSITAGEMPGGHASVGRICGEMHISYVEVPACAYAYAYA